MSPDEERYKRAECEARFLSRELIGMAVLVFVAGCLLMVVVAWAGEVRAPLSWLRDLIEP